jgi:hypothetical protein
MRLPLLASLCLVGCGVPQLAGLAPSNGALSIFSSANFCPADRVTVTRREDLPPSTVVGAATSPPPDIATDPGRLEMWRHRMAERNTALDQWGKTYVVSGCGHDQLYICGHPNRPEFIAGGPNITGDSTESVGDGTAQGTFVVSAVQCLPVAPPQPNVQFDADAVPMPERTEVPALPPAVRALTVRPIARWMTSDLRLQTGAMPPTLEKLCKASASQFVASFGWSVVDDASADLQAIVPCVGGLDATGKPGHTVNSLQDDQTVELVWPADVQVSSLELRARDRTIENIPEGPIHVKCDLPGGGSDRVTTCEWRHAQWDTARIARLLSNSQALAAYAAQRGSR